ncbi:type II toxin-antitoxin system HicB family antitoxin [Candidatus Thiosymbion oneisti]|uniref:type II toxin-antitoxin system HicB family antitoxin n=1 Tax=Candidatus Thiosymbion oneisti TaxID=589554 RepID=UPI000B1C379D|nr:type II toxin-antitoxin system HicB family antitoxin [Candidatus Thiosymbion oneisti]
MRYPVIIHKDPSSDYGVTVPDLPGCFSAGDTLDEALENAQEAIECHLEGMLLDGENIIVAKSLEEHKKNPKYDDGIWAIVNVDVSKLSGKAKRVNVTLPERLLTQMDNYASSHGESRSGLLAQAVIEYISNHSG